MTPHKLKADLAIIQATIKHLRQDLATALDVETDLKIKIYIEETGLNVGDRVEFVGGIGMITRLRLWNGGVFAVVTIHDAEGKPSLVIYESDKLTKI